ncbi:uncharacterized protein LOC141899922 [Tubulanus polymorphus]|uniref:uncharacterized protein LOC141899922 n=1 Tax=Tubulanus polymorphus TaxID=672921 RepID=UPI003DA4D969
MERFQSTMKSILHSIFVVPFTTGKFILDERAPVHRRLIQDGRTSVVLFLIAALSTGIVWRISIQLELPSKGNTIPPENLLRIGMTVLKCVVICLMLIILLQRQLCRTRCRWVNRLNAVGICDANRVPFVIIGLWVFGGTTLLFDFLEVSHGIICLPKLQYFNHSIAYNDILIDLLGHIVEIIFVAVELTFLTRFSGTVFDNKVGIRYAMFTLLLSNLCSWALIEIYDAGNKTKKRVSTLSYFAKLRPAETEITIDDVTSQCINRTTNIDRYLDKFTPFISPFDLEYCLLAAGCVLTICGNMKHLPSERFAAEDDRAAEGDAAAAAAVDAGDTSTESESMEGNLRKPAEDADIIDNNPDSHHDSSESTAAAISRDRHLPGYSNWRPGAHRRLLSHQTSSHDESPGDDDSARPLLTLRRSSRPITLLVLALILNMFYVATAVLSMAISNQSHSDDAFYYVSTMNYSILVIICWYGLHQVKRHTPSPEDNHKTQRYLLFLAIGGYFVFLNTRIISAVDNWKSFHKLAILECTGLIICLIQCWLQTTLFIQLSLHKPNIEQLKSVNNVQGVLVFLGSSNIACWVVSSFIEKQLEIAARHQSEYVRNTTWMGLVAISTPFALFYRFQSALVSMELYHRFKVRGDRPTLNLSVQ